jgi:hypothetical protein
MVLQAKAMLIGLGLAATAAVALSGESKAHASSSGKGKSSKGKKTPSGADPGHLADRTTEALLRQDIAGIRKLVTEWSKAADPLTAGALDFTLEHAVSGDKLEEWLGDGAKGSPLLRAFGDRVLLLEGRGGKLNLWADAWKKELPVLSAALLTKSHAIDVDPKKGTTDDPVPDAATLQKIIAVVESGDPTQIRKLADTLDRIGFDEQADDLRAMADMIEDGKAKIPDPERPHPQPEPEPHEEKPHPDEPKPDKPQPKPEPQPKPAGGSGRVVVVKSGEGPFQVTQRLLGKSEGARFRELVSENVPPKKKASDGGFTSLNPGERLKVPASWPSHPDAIADTGSSNTSPVPVTQPVSTDRFVVVLKGEGPWAITERVLGKGQGGRFHELVSENVPPKKKAADGGFTTLNPGERLRVPASWPSSPAFVAGDGAVVGADERQVSAGRVALCAHLGKLPRDLLLEWQRREKIPTTGRYDSPSAYVLAFRFGIVPPVPIFRNAADRQKFIGQMKAAARRDPSRADEFNQKAAEAAKAA